MPSASVTAKPKISRPNWPSTADGLRSAPFKKWPNSVPTPMPAAPVPMAASPAPMYLAATGSILFSCFDYARSVAARVKRVVQIHAGQHDEHIGLQKRDEQFERIEPNRHSEWQDRQPFEDRACPQQHDDESAEHVERDVAGEHVGEQTHRMAERAGGERNHLDRHHERENVDRHAGRNEKLEEVSSVLRYSDNDHRQENHERKRCGNDDLARHREGKGNEADQVAEQNEE